MTKTNHLSVGLLGAMLAASSMASAFDVEGKVVYVDDGDTVVLLPHNKTQMKIRLSSIDAPESSHTNKEKGRIGQPFADKSKAYLAGMIKGRDIQAHCFEQDIYKRNVCEIFVDGKSVNAEMVRQGMAWANQAAGGRYMRDKQLPHFQEQARAQHVGLWALPDPVEPWRWRDVCWKQGECQH